MTYTELAIPKLKLGSEVKDAFVALWPTAARALASEPAITRGYLGAVIQENETRTDQEENKPILIMEWTTEAAFNTFLTTDAFAAFIAPIKPLAVAPAELQIFETDHGPLTVASAPFMEIIRIQLKDIAEPDVVARASWARLVESLGNNVPVTGGLSLNIKDLTFMGTIGWESLEIRGKALATSKAREALAELKDAGDFSSIVIQVEPFKSA